jgi:hypothetical protein
VVEGRGQDLKRLKKYVGTNHLNNATREREKEWGGGQIFFQFGDISLTHRKKSPGPGMP